jgi:hypothetical protein
MTTGRYFDCPNCHRSMIPEVYTRRETISTALGSVEGRFSKSNTQFVAVNNSKRNISLGPLGDRTHKARLPKSRKFNPNSEEQFNPEDYPIAGNVDRDLVEWANSGIIIAYELQTGEDVEIYQQGEDQ